MPTKVIRVNGIQLSIDYDYQPAERMTRDYPGCAASVEINEVNVVFTTDDISDLLTQDALEHIEDNLLRELSKQEEP